MSSLETMAIKKIGREIISVVVTKMAMICNLATVEMFKALAIVPKKIKEFQFVSRNWTIKNIRLSGAMLLRDEGRR
jgi:hypothetical protein